MQAARITDAHCRWLFDHARRPSEYYVNNSGWVVGQANDARAQAHYTCVLLVDEGWVAGGLFEDNRNVLT